MARFPSKLLTRTPHSSPLFAGNMWALHCVVHEEYGWSHTTTILIVFEPDIHFYDNKIHMTASSACQWMAVSSHLYCYYI